MRYTSDNVRKLEFWMCFFQYPRDLPGFSNPSERELFLCNEVHLAIKD